MGACLRWPGLCLLVIWLAVPPIASADDGTTLNALKGVFQGSTPNALSTWTSSSFYCTWPGVFCSESTVYKLDLANQGLSASIVDVIDTVSKLEGLQYLYLNNNELGGGPIPDSLGTMTLLKGIHLQNNQIVGGLPNVFSQLTSIVELLISNNPLGGTLPPSLQSIVGLQSLDMSSCGVTGTIPSWMGSFQQMRLLYLGTNNFTGSLPALTGLSSIMEFYVNINQLTGSIPSSIGGLTTLVKLYLDRNSFSGPIPASLGGLSSLRSLYLDNTQINGTIPSELAKLLPTLTALDLRYTKLVGTVPVGLLSNAIVCDGYAPWGWPAGSGPICIFAGNPALVCPTGSRCPTGTPAPKPANTTVPVITPNMTAPVPNTSVPAPVVAPNGTGVVPAPGVAPSPGMAISPNGSVVGPNGTVTNPDGTVTDPDGNVISPNGTVINPDGTLTGPNGTVVGPNGTIVSPSGPQGTIILPNGTVIYVNGTVINTVVPSAPVPSNESVPVGNVCTCPVNQTAGLGSVPGRCNCVYGLGASFRLVDRNLTDWTPSFQTAFLNALAKQLGVQPFQIILGRAAQGSILLDTQVVPLVGTEFKVLNAIGIQDILEGRNDKSLRLNETQFGRVLVTAVTPPAQLDPSTPGSVVPNSVTPPSSSGSNTGAIIGGIVGAIAAVLIIAGVIWGLIVISKRRRKARLHAQSHGQLAAPAGGTSSEASFAPLKSKSVSVSITSFPQLSATNGNGPLSPPPPSPSAANAILSSPWRSSNSPVRSSNSPSNPQRKSTDSSREREQRSMTDSGYGGGHDTVSRTARLMCLRESTEVLPPWREFTSEEIRIATGNYAPENVLGSGLFGTVYKAQLADGRDAAVKRAEIAPSVLASRQAEFQRELETLSQLRHRHLVPFLGFCEVASRELMLVYDFMPNGTLQDNLPGGCRGVLDWPARVKVAVEVASAIEYLHNGCRPPIVHRDIKANNILLDEHDSAYLGDFGLATLYDAERTHITTAIKGTPGYLDPQYFATQELTQRSDVYSFGVLLLSVVTGKKAIFSVADLPKTDPDRARLQRQAIGKVNLTTWAVPLIREGRVSHIVDANIPDSERYLHDVEIVAEVAAECVQDRSQDRPDMDEVLVRLRGVLALVQQ